MRPYYDHAGITIYHGDCREVQAWRASDLVLADPPYGIDYRTSSSRSTGKAQSRDWEPVVGDAEPFDPGHLLDCDRLILFGANHYADKLPPSSSWIVWDKLDGLESHREIGFNDSSDCELAWSNIGGPARLVRYRWMGVCRRGVQSERRLHPTQKPVGMVGQLLAAYSKERDCIGDPYMGSGTTLVAAKQLGRKAIGIEIEERYCEIAAKRLSQEMLPFPTEAA